MKTFRQKSSQKYRKRSFQLFILWLVSKARKFSWNIFIYMRNVKDLLFLSNITHCAAIWYLTFLLRETPDQFFERPEHNQHKILVTGVDFTECDMLVDEKCIFNVKLENIVICWCTHFVYAFTVMIALHCVFDVTFSKILEATMYGFSYKSMIPRKYYRKFSR